MQREAKVGAAERTARHGRNSSDHAAEVLGLNWKVSTIRARKVKGKGKQKH